MESITKGMMMKQIMLISMCLILISCKVNRYVNMYYIGDNNYAFRNDSLNIVSDLKYCIIFNPEENCNGLYAIVFIRKNEDCNAIRISKITLTFKNLDFQVSKDCLIEAQCSNQSDLVAVVLSNQISCRLITEVFNKKKRMDLSDYDMYREMDKETGVILTIEGNYETESERNNFQRSIYYSVKNRTSCQFVDTLLNQ